MTPNTVMRAAPLLVLAAMATTWSESARAQRLVLGGGLGVASGAEGGDPGRGTIGFRRARTRLAVQVDGRIDEDLAQGVQAVLFAEIEPNASFGASLRYGRWLSPHFVAFGGATAVIAPHTLVGGEVGLQLRLGPESLGLFVEPSFAALPLGTDREDDRLILWGLTTLGVHASL